MSRGGLLAASSTSRGPRCGVWAHPTRSRGSVTPAGHSYCCCVLGLVGRKTTEFTVQTGMYLNTRGCYSSPRAADRVGREGPRPVCSGPSKGTTFPFCLPGLSYAWTFNDSPLHVQEDSRRFVSQETGNLYIAKVEPSDVGNYTCFVTNQEAQRSVRGPPTPLVQRPDGKTLACPGDQLSGPGEGGGALCFPLLRGGTSSLH